MSRRYYRIEVVSELLELPRAQIRRYEQEGLISPSARAEGDGRQRFYTEEDLRRLRRLRRMQRAASAACSAIWASTWPGCRWQSASSTRSRICSAA